MGIMYIGSGRMVVSIYDDAIFDLFEDQLSRISENGPATFKIMYPLDV